MTTSRNGHPAGPDLPTGQWENDEFPRFGLLEYAARLPRPAPLAGIAIHGAVATPTTVHPTDLATLTRHAQQSDFHCVATWSHRGLRWEGYRFRDVYEQLIEPNCDPDPDVRWAFLRGPDRYRVSVHLDDLLGPDVLLADTLDGQPLPREHGAPIRLVAPSLYGYKSIKHLASIELRTTFPRRASFVLDHPRGRVAHEERGRYLPTWAIRSFARAVIKPSLRFYRRSDERHGIRTIE